MVFCAPGMPLSKAALVTASASFDVVGAGYARYYYGIDAAGSLASGLPAYRPGGGISSAGLGLGGLVSLRGDLRKGFAVGGLVNVGLYSTLVHFAPPPLNNLYVALVVGVLAGLGFNFTLSRLMVFKTPTPPI